MREYIDAIYENGALRPLSPLGLSEQAHVQIAIRVAPEKSDQATLDRQQAAIAEMLAEFAELPLPDRSDGFSAADHDAALYGKPA